MSVTTPTSSKRPAEEPIASSDSKKPKVDDDELVLDDVPPTPPPPTTEVVAVPRMVRPFKYYPPELLPKEVIGAVTRFSLLDSKADTTRNANWRITMDYAAFLAYWSTMDAKIGERLALREPHLDNMCTPWLVASFGYSPKENIDEKTGRSTGVGNKLRCALPKLKVDYPTDKEVLESGADFVDTWYPRDSTKPKTEQEEKEALEVSRYLRSEC